MGIGRRFSFTTAANGIAGITGLADGNYHYELYHTPTDGVKSQWGWGMNIAVEGTTDFEITQNYPHHSGDNLENLTLETGVASSIDFKVKNTDVNGDDLNAFIEVWISKDKVETDFHYTMTAGNWQVLQMGQSIRLVLTLHPEVMETIFGKL